MMIELGDCEAGPGEGISGSGFRCRRERRGGRSRLLQTPRLGAIFQRTRPKAEPTQQTNSTKQLL